MLRTIKTTDGYIIETIKIPGRNLLPHSVTGPAIIYPDKTKEYYIYGIKYKKLDWEELVKNMKTKKEDIEVLNSIS